MVLKTLWHCHRQHGFEPEITALPISGAQFTSVIRTQWSESEQQENRHISVLWIYNWVFSFIPRKSNPAKLYCISENWQKFMLVSLDKIHCQHLSTRALDIFRWIASSYFVQLFYIEDNVSIKLYMGENNSVYNILLTLQPHKTFIQVFFLIKTERQGGSILKVFQAGQKLNPVKKPFWLVMSPTGEQYASLCIQSCVVWLLDIDQLPSCQSSIACSLQSEQTQSSSI